METNDLKDLKNASAAEKTRAWIEIWKRAGPILEEIRNQEIRAATTEENQAAMNALFEMGGRAGIERPSPTSGLVELQRILKRLRR